MPTTDTLTAVLERVVRSWWSHTFGDIRPHVTVHTGRPGPTDPRAATLLVWSASASPALVTLLDVEAAPATHGFDRAWRLTESLPGIWGSAIRAVPADGPAVRGWAERAGRTRTVQATHTRGRIRCTCTDEWALGLPPISPRPGEPVHVGVHGPPDWDRASIRRVTETPLPALVQHADGLRVRGHLEVQPDGATWTPNAWACDPVDDMIWFEARARDENEPQGLLIATTTTSHSGRAAWVCDGRALGLRWTPATPTTTTPAASLPAAVPPAKGEAGATDATDARRAPATNAPPSTATLPPATPAAPRPAFRPPDLDAGAAAAMGSDVVDTQTDRRATDPIATDADERTVRLDRSVLFDPMQDDDLTTTRLVRTDGDIDEP